MAVRLQLVPGTDPPDLIDLPWSLPLDAWDHPRLVRMARGQSRHVVRFVADGDRVYALKETNEPDARREYASLRDLEDDGLPVVKAAGIATNRTTPDGEPLDAVLVTRYLDYALPFRYLFTVEGAPGLSHRLLDAGVVLLARLHLEGVFWGDCSLSNLLFRRDAGALMAYLVDAETVERHDPLPRAMREADVELARENVAGGLLDLQAAGRLRSDVDPIDVADELADRYHALWAELTDAEEINVSDRHLIDRRLRRLNELGFDVDELIVEADADGSRLRVQPTLVEEGHHSRELRRLTGLEVQENQARRLLNDIAAYGTYLERVTGREQPRAVVAARWIADVFEPITGGVPDELRGRLEPAELFHELLEHRYLESERLGREVDNQSALASYIDSVLRHRPEEKRLPELD